MKILSRISNFPSSTIQNFTFFCCTLCIFFLGISTKVPLVQNKNLDASHLEQICRTQLKRNCLYSWHELQLSKQTFSHIQQIARTLVTTCLMAYEPPYYESLPIDIVCYVTIIFKVTILLFHKCMLPTFEDPQFFKLVCVRRGMW